MKRSKKVAGAVFGACAASCLAIGVLPGLLAGTSLATAGSVALLGWGAGIAAVLAGGAGLFHLLARRRAVGRSAPLQSASLAGCDCEASCAEASAEQPVIACTLDGSNFADRAASIRDLSRRWLRQVARAPLSIRLTYAPEAEEAVRDLVAQERACCSFLTYDLRNGTGGPVLTITAPPAAAEAAGDIFAFYAPDVRADRAEIA